MYTQANASSSRITTLISDAMVNKTNALVEIRKGKYVERKGLAAFLSRSVSMRVMIVISIIFFLLLLNEIFQLVKLRSRTPLSWLTYWCARK